MNIYQKIAKVKADIGRIPKDSKNPFFKSQYFDINSLLAHLEPLLHDNGLIVMQPIQDGCVCTEIIDIETSDKVTSCMELPQIADPQKVGSAISYYRRYSLTSLLSLQAEDDDGNNASGKTINKTEPITKKKWLTEEQFKAAMKGTPKQVANVLKSYPMKKEYKQELETLLDHINSI